MRDYDIPECNHNHPSNMGKKSEKKMVEKMESAAKNKPMGEKMSMKGRDMKMGTNESGEIYQK